MSKMDLEDTMILKLSNFLKGQAQQVRDANEQMYTPQQRLDEMKTIEEFLYYIKGYKRNKVRLTKQDPDDIEI